MQRTGALLRFAVRAYRILVCTNRGRAVESISLRRAIRNAAFHDYFRFRIDTVGTWNVSFPKPVSSALFPPDLGDGSNKLQFGCHPVTRFFRSVLVDALQLVFTAVAVPHNVVLLRRGSLMVNARQPPVGSAEFWGRCNALASSVKARSSQMEYKSCTHVHFRPVCSQKCVAKSSSHAKSTPYVALVLKTER